MVAAGKMKKAQNQAIDNRLYAHAIRDSLQKVAAQTDITLHPLLSQHETGREVIIIISSNKGLCGGLNTNLLRFLLKMDNLDQTAVIAVGKKAQTFLQKTDIELLAAFTELPEQLQPSDILPISSLIMDGFLKQEFRRVRVLYMDFINTISQKLSINTILPIVSETEGSELLENIPQLKKEYIFEPNPQEILNSLLPFYVENALFQVFLEARASEHSARMVAMKNASENAQELRGELQLLFNKSRQAAITEELRDITTASMTLA